MSKLGHLKNECTLNICFGFGEVENREHDYDEYYFLIHIRLICTDREYTVGNQLSYILLFV
jgi:hypothetical protein